MILFFNNDGHQSTLKIKGDFIDLDKAILDLQGCMDFEVIEHGHIQQAFETCLVEAV